ncbi:MAG TPA: cell division protein SepF [Clostridiales bacterium]|jgi:cell division inhibitor SepF|nr:cell division protein SepF [Clostridiales bacterium]HBE13376.1 cell division protein SepF [Clostridiales bacterium]HCG35644.1 cell division protein SepF [Clostridiales bacterium]
MSKFTEWLKTMAVGSDQDDPDGYAGEDSIDNESYSEPEYASPIQAKAEPSVARESRPSNFSMSSGASIEMKVVKPDGLDKVEQISDYLLDRKTVLLNLEDTNKENARRLIDFLNGVAYAINGSLKKVANCTYVITPSNVDVSGESLQAAASTPAEKSNLF